jgi:stage IV sporulation protein FB
MAGRHAGSWSLTLGRLWGVPVRLHFFFLLFVVLTLAVTVHEKDLVIPGILTLAILLASVFLHEMAHALAALRAGGRVDHIVIGPFGGLSSPRVPDEPEVHVYVALAGPLVHLSLAVISAAILSLGTDTNVVALLSPMASAELLGGSGWVIGVKLAFWLNWLLLLFNMLPAYPFDGGPALRAALWPLLGRRTACVVTSRVAIGMAIGLCVLAFVLKEQAPHPLVPLWVPLVMLAIFLFFSARQDLHALDKSGLTDDLAGYRVPGEGLDLLDELWSSDDEQDAVLVEQRNDRRRERQEQARRAQEEYEDARVDDILARLHRSSLQDLSKEERAVLERASLRYRQRKHPPKDG